MKAIREHQQLNDLILNTENTMYEIILLPHYNQHGISCVLLHKDTEEIKQLIRWLTLGCHLQQLLITGKFLISCTVSVLQHCFGVAGERHKMLLDGLCCGLFSNCLYEKIKKRRSVPNPIGHDCGSGCKKRTTSNNLYLCKQITSLCLECPKLETGIPQIFYS